MYGTITRTTHIKYVDGVVDWEKESERETQVEERKWRGAEESLYVEK